MVKTLFLQKIFFFKFFLYFFKGREKRFLKFFFLLLFFGGKNQHGKTHLFFNTFLFCKNSTLFREERIMLIPHNWTELCVTTCQMVSCDWQKCVPPCPTNTHLPIITRHVTSCDIRLCPIIWY